MAWFAIRRAKARTNCPPTRRRQLGFLRLSMFMARWSAQPFSISDAFKNGEPGAHFETYSPNAAYPRRNLLTWTDDFTNAIWTKRGTCTVTANQAIGVDGTMTMDLIAGLGALSTNDLFASTLSANPPPIGTPMSMSFYIRRVSTVGTLYVINAAGSGGAWIINLALVPDGLQRITATHPAVSVTTAFASTGTSGTRPQFGSSAGALSFYLGGVQLEAGATESVYQPVTDWNTEYTAAALESIGMWQDAAGTAPVTAVEQPLGLWLDGKNGKTWARGAEKILNGTNLADTASWTGGGGTLSAAGGRLVITATGAGSAVASQPQSFVVGTTYEVTCDYVDVNGRGVGVGVMGTQFGSTIASAVTVASVGARGPLRFIWTATVANAWVGPRISAATTAGDTATFGAISTKAIAGGTAHALQATAGQRPVLSARVNLITKSDQLADVAWLLSATTLTANAATGPVLTGNNAAAKLVAAVASGSATTHEIRIPAFAYVAGVGYVLSAVVRAAELSKLHIGYSGGSFATSVWAVFDLAIGKVTNVVAPGTATDPIALGGGWYLCQVSATASTSASSTGYVTLRDATNNNNFVGDGVSGIMVAGVDLRTADDTRAGIAAYQRVNTATDYDTVNFPHYLRTDGIDDGLATGNVDFSAFNKVSVWAGVTKLSDAAQGCLVEFSNNSTAGAAFGIFAPNVAASPTYFWRSSGTAIQTSTTPANYPAPISNVVTCLGSIFAPQQADIRVNGVLAGQAGATQGTGNYGVFPLFIGRRAGNAFSFTGRIYSLTVRGSATPASPRLIAQMEQYHARLAGLSFPST